MCHTSLLLISIASLSSSDLSSVAEATKVLSSVSVVSMSSVVDHLHLAEALDLTGCMGHWQDAGMGFPNLSSFSAARAVTSHVPMVA
jgi:hypothetical protein